MEGELQNRIKVLELELDRTGAQLHEKMVALEKAEMEKDRLKSELELFKWDMKEELKSMRNEYETKLNEKSSIISELMMQVEGTQLEKLWKSGRNEKSSENIKKTSENARKIRKCADSLCSDLDLDAGVRSDDLDSEGARSVQGNILAREVPKLISSDAFNSRDAMHFFKAYEQYCCDKFGENMRLWVKELPECLTGRLREICALIVSVGEPEYKVVKQRLTEFVTRMETGLEHKKKRDFEDARRGRNERLSMYAYRLETLARRRFGNDGINENVELLKKFMATVPCHVAQYINLKRKEKRRTNARLLWEDVLKIVEHQDVNGEGQGKEAYLGSSRARQFPKYPSYGVASMACPVEASKTTKRKGKKQVQAPKTKRTRIMQLSDSDDSSDEEEEEEEMAFCPPTPPPPQLKSDSEDDEVVPATPQEGPARRRRRKLVEKTYEDEDGYFVTEKVFEYVEMTEEEEEEEKRKEEEERKKKAEEEKKKEEEAFQSPPSRQSPKRPKTSPSSSSSSSSSPRKKAARKTDDKSSKKQSNITSFFTRK